MINDDVGGEVKLSTLKRIINVVEEEVKIINSNEMNVFNVTPAVFSVAKCRLFCHDSLCLTVGRPTI